MSKFKQILVAKVLLILLAAAALSYVDYVTPLKLGLDLQGGTQLDYKIDLSEVAEADRDQLVEGVKEVIRRRVDSLGVAEPLIYTSVIGDEHHVIVELAGISNIEEAKDIVGKTIQLEFKEQNTDVSEDKVAEAKTQAQSFYGDLTAGGDFIVLATEVETELGKENVFWVDQPLQEVSDYSDEMEAAVAGKAAGSILAPFEIKDGFTILADGSMLALDGVAVIQIVARDSIEKDVTKAATVSARHILVSYKGAERSTQERSKSEAETRAEEIKAKIDAGEKIVDLAPEWSDDTVSGQEGGDLGTFEKGVMTAEFEEAAFAMEVGQISEIVETPFGFHIIEVYGKTVEGTHKETVERIQLNKIIYLTTPDPWKDAVLTGEHFKHADVAFNQAYQPYVAITFNEEGAELFEEMTKNNIGKPIAIFVGGSLISSPTVNDIIVGGNATISGNFTLEEAQDLARELNTGAIPAPIVLSGQNTISATLGSEALDQSLFAGLIGVAFLMLFMLAYYRLPGLFSALGLAFYSLILVFFIKVAIPTVLAILIGLTIFAVLIHVILKGRDSSGDKFVSFLLACIVLFFITFVLANPITLTLAGIAGVVLSMGMAVDANVLIFERIKEELAEGKPLRESIEEGFKRAWDSIRDSNFSSLITCAILFYFGSSIIRGFALNLALGILISMFTAITLTRTFLLAAAESPLKDKLFLWNKPKHKRRDHFAIIKNSKYFGGFSIVSSLVAVAMIVIFGFNLGIDFTGGTQLEMKAPAESGMNQQSLTEAIFEVEEATQADFGTPHVVETDQASYLIRIKHVTEEQHDALTAKFAEKFGEGVEELRFTTVGPVIGETLRTKAMIALVITSIMIVLYIAFAFRKIPKNVSPWRFGVSAVVALLHDLLIVIGIFVVLGHFFDIEIDALFITALLTVMGFSVHDTIVVFDRIRENLKFQKEGESLAEVTNHALNQTMARSFNTSLCVLITLIAMLIFGPESTRNFLLALVIGIAIGTYSSVFVASSLLVWWNSRKKV